MSKMRAKSVQLCQQNAEALSQVRRRAVRMRKAALCDLRAKPMWLQQKAKSDGETGRWQIPQHPTQLQTTFWHPDGTPMSAQQFMELLYGKLPEFFNSEAELRELWNVPDTRAKLLQGLAEKDFGPDKLEAMQQLISAENSDLFEVLAYVAYALPPITRAVRADFARVHINGQFSSKQQVFLDFVLQHYVSSGVRELEQSKLHVLLRLRYRDSITDAVSDLGGKPEVIAKVFSGFQKYLYGCFPSHQYGA